MSFLRVGGPHLTPPDGFWCPGKEAPHFTERTFVGTWPLACFFASHGSQKETLLSSSQPVHSVRNCADFQKEGHSFVLATFLLSAGHNSYQVPVPLPS